MPVILLVRHGRSSLSQKTPRLSAAEFRMWIESYHQHGIAADSRPSDSLLAEARAVALVVCSDLPRAVESAHRIAPGRDIAVNPHLREAGWPLPGNWGGLRLPLLMWDWSFHRLWRCGARSVGESANAARVRAREVCAWLELRAQKQSPILVVGHGTFNQFLATELRRHHWQGPRRPADHYWGATWYERDGQTDAVAS
jgi:broad specificity phosphatase PhoE